MVFSFFKKRPQKMPERPAARPRAPESRPEVRAPKPLIVEVEPLSEPLPDLEFTSSGSPRPIPVEKKIEAPASAVPEEIALAVGEFDFEGDFTESSVMAIDVEHAGEPLQADIEQVVVMFANGQDSAARALLEMLIRAHPGREGQRFWALLFDLLQVVGDRPAFEKLTVEFTKACEISPPSWRQAQPISAGNGSGTQDFVLQGVLTADGAQPVAELAKLVGQGPVEKRAIRVDCGKLIGCDDWVAGQLAELLSQARRCGPALMLENTAVPLITRSLSSFRRLHGKARQRRPLRRLRWSVARRMTPIIFPARLKIRVLTSCLGSLKCSISPFSTSPLCAGWIFTRPGNWSIGYRLTRSPGGKSSSVARTIWSLN